MKKGFLGFGKPHLEYSRLPARLEQPEFVPASGSIALLHHRPAERKAIPALGVGDPVKTGQRISLYTDCAGYVTAPATGRIAALSPFSGVFGQRYTSIAVTIDPVENVDDQFASVVREPTLAAAESFLAAAPGLPPLAKLARSPQPLRTLVICGIDDDLLVLTQQYVLHTRSHSIEAGIRALKAMTGIEDFVILALRESIHGYGRSSARIMGVDNIYPSARPPLVMRSVFGKELPAGRPSEDLGFCFMSAEAAASIGAAFETGRVPVTKTLTLIAPDGSRRLVQTAIGTPIGDILKRFRISIAEGDRLVLGGPMRGAAVHSPAHPVQPDTDSIMVVDSRRAAEVSDYPCVNCGECVRTCPARMQVNLLVRYLEAGKYQDAEESYDLHSCIECGLCSYVCVSRIPIFQYITLAKHELARMRQTEEANA